MFRGIVGFTDDGIAGVDVASDDGITGVDVVVEAGGEDAVVEMEIMVSVTLR